jgi:hypothetical protein
VSLKKKIRADLSIIINKSIELPRRFTNDIIQTSPESTTIDQTSTNQNSQDGPV